MEDAPMCAIPGEVKCSHKRKNEKKWRSKTRKVHLVHEKGQLVDKMMCNESKIIGYVTASHDAEFSIRENYS
jgi:hypothetical protein